MERGVARIGNDEWVKGQWKHGFMEFIHTVNGLCEERGIEQVFGSPTFLGDWWVPGFYVEQYPRARVVFQKKEHRDPNIDEGYRIVTDDPELFELWDEAGISVYPRIENRPGGDPTTCKCPECTLETQRLDKLMAERWA